MARFIAGAPMSFTNLEIDLETLPHFAEVEYRALDPRYARVVLGVALVFQVPIFLFVSGWLIAFAVSASGPPAVVSGLAFVAVLLLFLLLAWFSYKSASVLRYAIREHDVILRSGVFWKKDTVQPIRRIQHIEQNQGPVDKRFGLYELKLFSAGTGNVTFRIPGLDADSASRIRKFILNIQEDGWAAAAAPESEPVVTAAQAGAHD
jgi:membrane protein YdbS with pleckstrin-like domain